MKERERAILVFLDSGQPGERLERTIEELSLLSETAGAEVVHKFIQKRAVPDRAYYLGRGKSEELAALVKMLNADMVIFNDELTPSQLRNLDAVIESRIIDRSALILDIFVRRALSREGKLQVELAQLQYLLPRLIGFGSQLSRLGAGIGTRGPGETKLETDRRVIRRRIADMKREIASLRKHRKLLRERRKRNRCQVISLVGYTNAGKSTLLNALTGANLYTEDKLFATLDPMVRRAVLNNGREVLFADTVGFIEDLPLQLVAAFQATIEEIADANILLHIVDLNHPNHLKHLEVVRDHLSQIDPHYHQRELLVFNKIDLGCDETIKNSLKRKYPNALFVSAENGDGLQQLKDQVIGIIESQHSLQKIYLPYNEGKWLSELMKRGCVDKVEYKDDYLEISAYLDKEMSTRLKRFAAQ